MKKIFLSFILVTLLISCGGSGDAGSGIAGGTTTGAGAANSPVGINTSLSPANGSYGESGELIFQIDFSASVFVTGTPHLILNIGGATHQASYRSGSGSSSLEFVYQVSSGDNDSDGIALIGAAINFNGGSIKDVDDLELNPGLGTHFSNLSGVLINTAQAAPSKVLNLATAPTTNDTSVSLSWNVPAHNGTPITEYIVQYKENGSSSWIQYNSNPSSNSVTVAGLISGTTYDFRVAASNGVLGPYSDTASASSFNILDLHPIAWLDATDINGDGSPTANDTKIAAWVDKSGTATNAVEADSNKQPVLKTNTINGLPAVRFDNLDRGLEGSFNRTVNAGLTIFIVGSFDSGHSDKCIFEFRSGGARAFFIDRRYAGNSHFSPSLSKGSFKQWRVEDSGAISSVFEAGSAIQTNTNNTFNTSFIGTGTYVLGDDTTGGNRMHGYIAEFLVFDGILTNGDIAIVENYLNQKWGL